MPSDRIQDVEASGAPPMSDIGVLILKLHADGVCEMLADVSPRSLEPLFLPTPECQAYRAIHRKFQGF